MNENENFVFILELPHRILHTKYLNHPIAFNISQIALKGHHLSAKEKPLVLCFIDPNSEPTRHSLKELGAMKADFEKWGGNILMVIPKDKLTQPFDKKHWNLPENTMVTTDDNGLLAKILSDTKQYFRDNYPLIFIVDNRGQLTFKSEGYRIGTAELVFKSL